MLHFYSSGTGEIGGGPATKSPAYAVCLRSLHAQMLQNTLG